MANSKGARTIMSLVDIVYELENKLNLIQKIIKLVTELISGTANKDLINSCLNRLRANKDCKGLTLLDKLVLWRNGYDVKKQDDYVKANVR